MEAAFVLWQRLARVATWAHRFHPLWRCSVSTSMRKWSFLRAVCMRPSHSWSPSLQGHAPSWSASSRVHFPPLWLLCVQLQQVFFRLLPWPLLFCVPFLDNLGSPRQPTHSQDCWAVWKLSWPSASTTVPADPADQSTCHLLPWPTHWVSSPVSLFFFSPHGLSCTCFRPIKSLSAGDSTSQLSLRSDLFSDPISHELRPLSPCIWITVSAPTWPPNTCVDSFSACRGHYPKRQICCHLSALKQCPLTASYVGVSVLHRQSLWCELSWSGARPTQLVTSHTRTTLHWSLPLCTCRGFHDSHLTTGPSILFSVGSYTAGVLLFSSYTK